MSDHLGPSTWASDVRAIIDLFLLKGKNEIATYKEMEALIGKPVTGASSIYQVAKRRLSDTYHIVIKTIPRVGGKRLDDGGIVEELPGDRATIQRRVERSLQKAANIENPEALSNSQKLEYLGHLAHMGLVRHLQEPQVDRALQERVQRELPAISVDKLITLCRS